MDVSGATPLAAEILNVCRRKLCARGITGGPYNRDLLSVFPYAPRYLDLIEEWLRGLP
jgi:hypothetical protein